MIVTEKQVQEELIKTLRKLKCYVVKTRPGAGVPVGCPDIIFFNGSIYGVIECKRSSDSPYRPLQRETLDKFKHWSVYSRTAHPGNLKAVQTELEAMLSKADFATGGFGKQRSASTMDAGTSGLSPLSLTVIAS